jgi:hypothetical protein
MMRVYGHVFVWGTHGGASRSGWLQQLRDGWAARKAARRQAQLAALAACWHSQREAIRPLRAEAAPEMAAAQGALTVVAMLYGLSH